MEHEGDPLGRVEGVENDEECGTHRVGQDGLILRGHCRSQGELLELGRRIDGRGLTPVAAPERIEADPRDHGRQPAREVPDIAVIRRREAEPGLLQGIVGVLHIAEDPKGHGAKVGPTGPELVHQ